MSDLPAPTEHRPYPPPTGPWVMHQRWHDLLFAHWPVPEETMRALVPRELPLDTYDGTAWLAVTPFRMSDVRPRYLPALPWLSAFPELNVRTYVTLGGKPGVYFFSLDAANPVAVTAARQFFSLPYYTATMSAADDGTTIHYRSRRTHAGAPGAELAARYRPTGAVFHSTPGSLEYWLTERYCLYTLNARRQPMRAEIHHAQWPLQPAEAEFEVNTMAAPLGLTLPPAASLLHFARRLDVVVWLPERA